MSSLERRKYAKGISWRYVYRDESGKQQKIKIGFTNKRTAEQRKAKLDSMLAQGEDPKETLRLRKSIKLSALQKLDSDWSVHRVRPRTIEINRGIVMRFIQFAGDIPINQITRKLAEEYLAHCANELGYKVNTTNMHLRQLKALFNRAIKQHGLLKENPFVGIEPYTTKIRSDHKVFLTVDQLDALFQATQNRWGTEFCRLLRFYSLTGARRGEATDLMWSEIDYNRNLLYLGQEDSQTKLRRDFPIRPPLRELLEQQAADRNDHDHVFWRFRGQEYHITGRLWRMNGTVEGIPEDVRLGPHLLRHTFASHLVMAGVDMRTVASLMGHSTTKVTELYSHLAESHRESALDKLPY